MLSSSASAQNDAPNAAGTTSSDRKASPPATDAATEGGRNIQPPKLHHYEAAQLPKSWQSKAFYAEVVLKLTVASDGSVSSAEVVQPAEDTLRFVAQSGTPPVASGADASGPASANAGPGHRDVQGSGEAAAGQRAAGEKKGVHHAASEAKLLDGAAQAAALKFRFAPALVDGKAVTVRIPYRYIYAINPQPQAATQGSLSMRVLERQNGKAIAGVRVRLTGAEGQTEAQGGRDLVTDERGVVEATELQPGNYRVELQKEGLGSSLYTEQVLAGKVTELTYRLGPMGTSEAAAFGAVATVEAPRREVTRRTIERELLRKVPGTRGDPLRTIELLPGVARPPQGSGNVIIRGSSPLDSQVYLDGAPVPILYHLQGLTSFYNGALIDSIDFYPGNFSTRYGRKTGGVVEVKTRDLASDRVHGVADINIIDGSLMVETPINDKWSIAGAARRSWIDFWIGNLISSDTLETVAAPVYWDYQGLLTYRPNRKNRIRLSAYGSGDELRLLTSAAADTDPSLRGNIGAQTAFHRVQLDWKHRFNASLSHEMAVTVGPEHIEFGIGPDIDFEQDSVPLQFRSEWSAQVHERVRLIGGLDVFVQPFDIAYSGPQPGQSEGSNFLDPIAVQEEVVVRATDTAVRPAAYLESILEPLDGWTLIPGLRLDYFGLSDRWTIDPRLATRYALSDSTRLKAGVGMFSQAPELNETSEAIGNPSLEPIRAVQASAGVEQDIDGWLTTGAEGFYKHLYNRPVAVPSGLPPRFVNEGIGRIYGLELSARLQPNARYFGFLSYTLQRSERKDLDDKWRLFDFDQTHILTASGGYEFKHGWSLGATFRYVTGNPQTPVIGSIYDSNSGVYIPLQGQLNSARDPSFHRLDVRAEKRWDFDLWKLYAYLDIQNVYNRQNPEGFGFNYDFSEVQSVAGLPIIPSIGIRGEL